MDPIFSTETYNYHLPEEHIAQKPLKQRDDSKLLSFSNGEIEHLQFSQITEALPKGATLFFNNAKVIPARTFFKRKTGAEIEIFLLNPTGDEDIQQVLESNTQTQWQCMIRNLKKWKDEEVLTTMVEIGDETVEVQAHLVNRKQMWVTFHWSKQHSFSEVLEALGKIPLPPYIKRESEESDKETYQTVYAENEGAVAAPTAGLHFTEEVQERLAQNGIPQHYMTLHVGAGTFKPVSSGRIDEHEMHEEHFECQKETLLALANTQTRIAVGTTSLRTMESLYWVGVKIQLGHENPFKIEQTVFKDLGHVEMTYSESMREIISYMNDHNLDTIKAATSIMIHPGYEIRAIEGLITNFHLPKSTLIMLVAAFIGDSWRDVYAEAVKKQYRFLSYGDSSLLMP